MDVALIKYSSIVIACVAIYLKVLNIKKLHPVKYLIIVIFTLLSSFLSYKADRISLYLCLISTVVLLTVFFKIIFREQWKLTFIATLLSYGMSYVFYVVAAIITAVFFNLFLYDDTFGENDIEFLIIFAIQLVLIFSLFGIKRLKTGFTFLRKEGIGYFAIFFSFFILLFVSVCNRNFYLKTLVILSIIGMIICASGIIYWWHTNITRTYIDSLKEKELVSIKKDIDSKNQEIEILKERNQFLSSIIHRDNKLLPSMSLAIQNFVWLSLNQLDEETADKALLIWKEIEAQSGERVKILSEYQNKIKALPQTNIFRLDAVFEYLREKAVNLGITYDVCVLCDVKFMTSEVISEANLETLLRQRDANACIPY